MPIDLTHIGEALVQKLIELRPHRFFELCRLPVTEIHGGRVIREAKLRPFTGKRFDGASRVDLVVPISASESLPVEVKLGTTRLSKGRVENEWLTGCRVSHDGTAWAGNMMSILDNLVPSDALDQHLVAVENGVEYSLRHEWCVVVRRSIAGTWAGADRPSFGRATVVAFEDLAEEFTQPEFDKIVSDLLSFSYYEAWVTNA